MKSKNVVRGLVCARHGALVVASVALGGLVGGCAAPVPGDGGGEPAAKVSQALKCNETGDANSGDCPWRFPWKRLVPQNGQDITHTWAPAILSGSTGWLAFSVDNTNHYRMLQFRSSGPTSRSPSWGTYGPTRTWKSKPALAHREDSASGLPGFVVAGKLSDNKIMTSSGIMAPSDLTLGTPTPDKAFEQVDGTAFASSNGGLPALTNFSGYNFNHIVLVYMGDDGRTVYAHTRNIPYNSGSWSKRIDGPTLDAGWSVVYAPTVTREYATGMLTVLIHAKKGTTDALFATHLYDTATSTVFSNVIGSPGKVWYQLPSIGTVNDDPILSWSDHDGLTVYFLKGTNIAETAFGSNPPDPVLSVAPSTGIKFTSSPSVTADAGYDQGTHVVAARAGSAIYMIDSNTDDHLDPTL